MIEPLLAGLATDGLGWIVVATLLAGLVRGFAGFGAAMIFVPVVGVFADPVTTVVALQIMDGLGALPLLPRGYRDGEPSRVAPLVAGSILALPVGVYFLATTDSTSFRWIVAGLILVLLALMASGWRYTNRLSARGTMAVGAVSGFSSGFFGLGGPPVVLMYMSGPYKPAVIRGNIILFFFVTTMVSFVIYIFRDLLTAERIWFGLILTVPYLAGTVAGARIFQPAYESRFRAVAYAVILGSVGLSLPLWS